MGKRNPTSSGRSPLPDITPEDAVPRHLHNQGAIYVPCGAPLDERAREGVNLAVYSKQQGLRTCRDMDRAIEEFTPRLPPDDWAVIGEFVRDCAHKLPRDDAYRANLILWILTSHVHWAHFVAGIPLEPRDILAPDLIEESMTRLVGTYSTGTLANYRSVLYLMTRSVLGEGVVPRRLRPLRTSDPLRPYSAKELIEMRSWVLGQTTAQRREESAILVDACAGGGTTSRELAQALVGDVEVADDYVLIHVTGERARTIAVFDDWTTSLRKAVAATDPGQLLFRPNREGIHRNVVDRFLQGTNGYGIRPTPQRLRVTWLVRHLELGTPVRLLLAISGLKTLSSVIRYVEAMDPPSALEIRRLCQGGL